MIVSYLPLFNGKRIVTIVEGKRCAPFAEVVSRFPKNEAILFIRANNDPVLGEHHHFIPMIRWLKSDNPDEITFYAHAKGVKYESDMQNVRAWREKQYHHNLSNLEYIEWVFSNGFDCLGSFKRYNCRCGRDGKCPWFYSGTFWWFRHSALFSSDWERMQPNCRAATEGYLGKHIPVEKAYCSYGDGLTKYRKDTLYKISEERMTRWDQELIVTLEQGGKEHLIEPLLSHKFPMLTCNQILDRIGKRLNAQSYLKIEQHQVSLGVYGKPLIDQKQAINEFFEHNSQYFDLVFIDGDHSYEQACKDVNNSLLHLAPGGVIVMHDTCPSDDIMCAKSKTTTGPWTGESYKAAIEALSTPGVEGYTVDCDFGVTVLWKAAQPQVDASDIGYHAMKADRSLLNIIETTEFDAVFDGAVVSPKPATMPPPARVKVVTRRCHIINHIGKAIGAQNYLELGVRCLKDNFNKINLPKKTGVDIEAIDPLIHKMSTSEFFRTNKKKFDLIFIDADHRYDGVRHDLENALEHLTDKGVIVMHDCFPATLRQASPEFKNGAWCGEPYKVVAEELHGGSIRGFVVQCDYGVGVFRPGSNMTVAPADRIKVTFQALRATPQLVNLIKPVDFVKNFSNLEQ